MDNLGVKTPWHKMTLSTVSFISRILMSFTADTEAPGKLLVGLKKPLVNIPQHSVPLD